MAKMLSSTKCKAIIAYNTTGKGKHSPSFTSVAYANQCLRWYEILAVDKALKSYPKAELVMFSPSLLRTISNSDKYGIATQLAALKILINRN